MNDSFKDCPGTAALLWGPRAQAWIHSRLSSLTKPSGQCWTHTPKGKGSDDTHAHRNFLCMHVFS